jgi:hypothetical protein
MTKTTAINLNDLLLDKENPRLPTTVGRKQEQMIAYIARTTSIAEIMEAIAENDFFPGEPLVVVPDSAGKYVVVVGNRRLTALMLLQSPELYGKSRKIHEIAAGAKFKPKKIPCVVFDDRAEVLNYLGYRHITGVKQWEPLAKARYVANYFDLRTDKDVSPAARYTQVARGIGSQAPYIKRQLDGLSIYNCIEQKGFYNIEGLDEENISFSLISTAIGYDSILSFVSGGENPYLNPDVIKKKNVEHLSRWMFLRDKNGETILGDSRNIQRLAIILANDKATDSLVAGDSLDRAYSLTQGLADDFLGVLAETESQITHAVSMVALVDLDDAHRSRINNIYKQARSLKNQSDEA